MKLNFEKKFFVVLTILALIATASVYAFRINGPPIRSDGIGYYSYLPAIFVYGDLSMNSLIQERTNHYQSSEMPMTWNGIYKYPGTNNYMDKYTMGEAVLMSPFFLVAHLSTLVVNHFVPSLKVDGFSAIYQISMAISGLFYGMLGLFILKRVLDRYFSERVSYITIVLILFGTDLFHYFTYDNIFSHAYSLFLFALLLYLIPLWYKKMTLKSSLIIGIVSGLIVLIRPTNIVFPALLIPLYGIDLQSLISSLKARAELLLRNWKFTLPTMLMTILIFLPQLFYWKFISGNFFVFSYQGEYFDFAHPEIFNVLLSARKGAFFWAPLLILAVAGIALFMTRRSRKHEEKSLKNEDLDKSQVSNLKSLILPSILYLILNLYIISSWWTWSYGGSFGHRAFIESYAILALFLGIFVDFVLRTKNGIEKKILILISIFCVLLSVYTMFLYWFHYVPIDGTTPDIYLKALTLQGPKYN